MRSSWWVLLPGWAALALMIGLMLNRRPWPKRVPVHFDAHFHADRWGSPWVGLTFPILALMIVIIGSITSVAWARHEQGSKRFNLTLVVIAAPLGAIVGLHCWYWGKIGQLSAAGTAPGGWMWMLIGAIALAISCLALESLRRPIPADAN
jgi:hypothetical protein